MATTADHIADGAYKAGAQAEETIRRKAGQLQKFFDDVEELLKRVANLGDAEVSKLRTRVESSIETAKSAARSGVHVAVDSTKKAAIATDDYVRTNPWKAIGATAAVALLVGALLRGNRN